MEGQKSDHWLPETGSEGRKMDTTGHKRTIRGAGNILYHSHIGGHTTAYFVKANYVLTIKLLI